MKPTKLSLKIDDEVTPRPVVVKYSGEVKANFTTHNGEMHTITEFGGSSYDDQGAQVHFEMGWRNEL